MMEHFLFIMVFYNLLVQVKFYSDFLIFNFLVNLNDKSEHNLFVVLNYFFTCIKLHMSIYFI